MPHVMTVFDITVSVFYFTLCVVIVCSNGITLVAMCKTPALRALQCQYTIACLYSSITISMFTMCSVAADRYIYIVHPFFYLRHMTAKIIVCNILSQWGLATIYGFMSAYISIRGTQKWCDPILSIQQDYFSYVIPVCFVAISIGIAIMYGLIARTAKQHFDRKVRRLQDMQGVLSNCSNATIQMKSPVSLAQKLRSAFKLRNTSREASCFHELTPCADQDGVGRSETNASAAEGHSAGPKGHDAGPQGHPDLVVPSTLASFRWIKQMVVVFGLFTVFWTPVMVYIILSFVYSINSQVLGVLFTLGIANSAVNFFVYSYYNSKFRQVIRGMFLYGCKSYRS
ncbi:uncharacterized protein LOC131943072 [Physella acuta]|uniref:uncharacterized protein LOC131943072 n=1 Tax=Physella acuta TaxID=109671 RepID=UPI0027DCF9AA|nr:uncharacterized protein LOC131943072 [Physella acuta]